ncbi:hypothetical protein [Paenibacillus sp. Soil522]|uniref:hypothetical protein n=1 Tax=Paenibacillus sp. Soil522 TaxID=1736388 RepID=UPI000AF7646C|nr:hypothetical protein [Paenibacillus sp. Soil522]
MVHVFITGGTGFIGLQVVRRLAAEGPSSRSALSSMTPFRCKLPGIFSKNTRFLPP